MSILYVITNAFYPTSIKNNKSIKTEHTNESKYQMIGIKMSIKITDTIKNEYQKCIKIIHNNINSMKWLHTVCNININKVSHAYMQNQHKYQTSI